MRGQPDEDAVLCTQSKTYAIKFVGTSNSVFLIPPSDQSEFSDNLVDENDQSQLPVASVIKVATGTMELVEVAPKLDKLKLLFKNLYRPEVDIEMEGLGELETGLFKWDDLVDLVQASDDELLSGLQALSALEIDGYWRVVDVKYMDMMLRMLLHNSVLNDWSLDALDQDKVVDVLQSDGFPRKLAEHCLCVYGHKVSEGVETNCVWKLDERKVCVHFAREILRGGKKKIEKFMEEWNRKVPECMQASFTMLEGEVLTERFGVETWVSALSVSSLPSSPAERFSLLFKERQKWEWKDLQPYIRLIYRLCFHLSLTLFFVLLSSKMLIHCLILYSRDLSVPGLSSEGLLLKYTRRTQPTADAEPVFSAR